MTNYQAKAWAVEISGHVDRYVETAKKVNGMLEYLEWVREARRAVGDGATRQQASDHAWNHIGKPPPKPGPPAILQRKQGILDLEKVPRDDGNRPGV